MSKIENNLEKLYTKYRIVVWYDPEKAFADELVDLQLKDVTLIQVAGDEFATKYKILVEHPCDKFLLYMPYERPPSEDNWLLDIELSQKIFHTNRESLLLDELELPMHYQSWIQKNLTFFNNKERMNKFRRLASKNDSTSILNLKLIQVIMGADQHDLDYLLREYVNALKDDKAASIKEALDKYGLSSYFWGEVQKKYEIDNDSHILYDFLLRLFRSAFKLTSPQEQIMPVAKVALSNWKDLQSFAETYMWLSKKIATDLSIDEQLHTAVLEDLLDEDLFECIDKHIIHDLVEKVSNNVYAIAEIEEILKYRENKYWYPKYRHYYEAIYKATLLFQTIGHTVIQPINVLESGLDIYASAYYKVDQYYRQFISLVRKAEASAILKPLYQKVENAYSNKWLLELSSQWQQCIEHNKSWYLGSKSLFNFYKSYVKEKYVDQNRKVFVIISDALRYEIGEELHRSINQQNRFESKIDYMVTGLPSYTQLGMAAMLPHLSITFGESDDVYIDGLSTKGSQPRARILQEIGKIRATTISAQELASFKVKSEEAKALVQNNDVVYVYHNSIDKTGDDKISEERVFDAVESELEHLVSLIKRISSINISHILVTADHGFIYQNEELHESEFADAKLEGTIAKSNRRFIIGRDLKHNDVVFSLKANDLLIDSDADVLIAKGITRLRRQGAGSRFVHGGASFQEVVVPVLQIVKKREDTLSKVDVDILNKANNRITTNIHPIRFYQPEPTTQKRLGRKIKAYFAVGGDKLEIISDVFLHHFDSDATRSEDREVSHNFKLATTLQKHSEVYLYLDEEIEGSTTWKNYARFRFTLTLGMMNDFDDF